MKRLIRNSRVFILLVVLALVGVTGTIGIVYASNRSESTVYRICVDQRGNMRLLGPDIKGNYGDECKRNEFMIKLPSNRRVSELIAELEAELVAKLSELGDNVTDVKVRISILESIVSEQGGKIIELEGIDTEHADNITALWERLAGLEGIDTEHADNITALWERVAGLEGIVDEQADNTTTLWDRITELEGIVDEQADNITALWDRIAELEGDSGNGNSPDGIVTEGLVLCLSMDEGQGSTVYDSSGYGNNGIINGATWVNLDGGAVLSFDGVNDVINCGNDTSLDITEAITLEVWVKADALTAGSYYAIAGRDDGANRNFLLFFDDAGKLSFRPVFTGTGKTAQVTAAASTDVWYHCVATYDSFTVRVYQDGVVGSTEVSISGAIDNDNVSFQLGRRGAGWYFSGLIGEVRVYNRALSPEEIQQNYLATKQRYE